MKRVTGIGGIFFKSSDPDALGAWYRRHLGFDVRPWGGAPFGWNRRDRKAGGAAYTVWAPFAEDSRYFEPGRNPWMINLRVDNLDRVLDALRAEGVTVLERRDRSEQGDFGYIVDPDGTLVELWQPAADDPALAQV